MRAVTDPTHLLPERRGCLSPEGSVFPRTLVEQRSLEVSLQDRFEQLALVLVLNMYANNDRACCFLN